MTTALADVRNPDAEAIERVLIGGDLSRLTESQRVAYYNRTCESLGLNPLTRPFDYITLNGKLTLYARKDATEQLRMSRGVSIQKLEKVFDSDLYIVTAYAADKSGRTDVSTGAVTIGKLTGEARANAIMKAETKAKRRVTLSICGLGMLDETEAADVTSNINQAAVVVAPALQAAQTVTEPNGDHVETQTGEVDAAPERPHTPANCYYIDKCEPHSGAGRKQGTVTVSWWDYEGGAWATQAMAVWEGQVYTLAEAICQEGSLVTIVSVPSEKWGPTLKALKRYQVNAVAAPKSDDPPMFDENGQPF